MKTLKTRRQNIDPLKVSVFASGRGSNLQAILESIDRKELACKVVLVVSNNSNSGSLSLARKREIPALHLSRAQFDSDQSYHDELLHKLRQYGTELIALAGYMKKISPAIIAAYSNRILNIHPALLPAFGGKGMYGMNVHRAVLEYGCKVSGVTVHLVDLEYDTGPSVLQKCVSVKENDTAETLAARVLEQEHALFSEALQLFAEGRVEITNRKVKIKAAIELKD